MPDASHQAAEAALIAELDQMITAELNKHADVTEALACIRGKYLADMHGRPAFDARHLGGVADGIQIASMVVQAATTRTALAAMTQPTPKEEA